MIAGLESIDEGALFIDGVLANKISQKDRNIAMVFQNYALYPHMNAYKNMEFGLKMRKVSKHERHEIVMRTAETLQIGRLLDRKPGEMSGGERQRVALGRAMVRNPEIFLLDEPLSNLDAALRTETRYNIMKLHKKLGATFIYVTHDQTEAMTMANRIAVMNKGRIEQADTPERIYKYPANKFVAEFIGMPKMNMIPAKLMHEGGKYHLLIGKAKYVIPENRFNSGILDRFLNEEVIAGFRAEDIMTSEAGADKAIVELTEIAGPETFIHINFENNILISRRSGIIDVLVGKTTGMQFNMDNVHIFDCETGISLLNMEINLNS